MYSLITRNLMQTVLKHKKGVTFLIVKGIIINAPREVFIKKTATLTKANFIIYSIV